MRLKSKDPLLIQHQSWHNGQMLQTCRYCKAEEEGRLRKLHMEGTCDPILCNFCEEEKELRAKKHQRFVDSLNEMEPANHHPIVQEWAASTPGVDEIENYQALCEFMGWSRQDLRKLRVDPNASKVVMEAYAEYCGARDELKKLNALWDKINPKTQTPDQAASLAQFVKRRREQVAGRVVVTELTERQKANRQAKIDQARQLAKLRELVKTHA